MEPSLVSLAVLFFTLAFLDLWLHRIAMMPSAGYESHSLTISFFRYLGWGSLPLLVLAPMLGIAARSPDHGWSGMQAGGSMRFVSVTAAGLLVWMYAGQVYNLYLDQGHLVDRGILFLLWLGLIRNPAFALMFLLALLPLISQAALPLGGFSWAVPLFPMRILILLVAFQVTRLVTGSRQTSGYSFALCCLYGMHYWPSGSGKLLINWLSLDRVCFLLPTTYANGWLGFLAPQSIERLTMQLSAMNEPIKLLTIFLECGVLFLLWRRAYLMAVIGGLMCMHLGIFLVTGICFWVWVILDAALLWVVWSCPGPWRGLFTRRSLLLSAMVIVSSTSWLRPVRLSWLDSRATYTYRFEAVGPDRTTHQLLPPFFDPYAYNFSLGQFGYLARHPILSITWGAAPSEVAKRLNQARSDAAVLKVESELGSIGYSESRSRKLADFLTRFIANHNRRVASGVGRRTRLVPPYIWHFSKREAAENVGRIEQVNVFQVLSYFDDRQYREIARRKVLEIQITDP